MLILIGAVAVLYMIAMGLYVLMVIAAVLFTGIKAKWSEL